MFRFLCFPPPRSTETSGPTSVLMWRQESSEERMLVVEGGGVGVRCGGSWSLTLAGSAASAEVDLGGRRMASSVAAALLRTVVYVHTRAHTREEALTINFQLKCVASGAFNRGKHPSQRRFPLSALPTSLRQATIKCMHCQKVCQSAGARPPVT